jgi:hypothetical protein
MGPFAAPERSRAQADGIPRMAFRRGPSDPSPETELSSGSARSGELPKVAAGDPLDDPDAIEADLPLGVEPWTGEDMPVGTASSHDLRAPGEPSSESAWGETADLEPPASPASIAESLPPEEPLAEADEMNYRRIYESRFKDLEIGMRADAARQVSGSELFALCLDPNPQVIAALLENTHFGLGHARSVALHHHTDRGLEILARRAQLVRDSHVQRRLLQNTQTPDVVLDRILRLKRLIDVYRASVDRDLPERNRVRVRTRLRPQFMRAEPDDRAALIIKTEGRCLLGLSGCTFDARTTQILCNQSAFSTLFIQNLARFPATPPPLIAKLLRSPTVQRQPALRTMLARHPNAGSEAKRKS